MKICVLGCALFKAKHASLWVVVCRRGGGVMCMGGGYRGGVVLGGQVVLSSYLARREVRNKHLQWVLSTHQVCAPVWHLCYFFCR